MEISLTPSDRRDIAVEVCNMLRPMFEDLKKNNDDPIMKTSEAARYFSRNAKDLALIASRSDSVKKSNPRTRKDGQPSNSVYRAERSVWKKAIEEAGI